MALSIGLVLVIVSAVYAESMKVDPSADGDVETDWIDFNAVDRERQFLDEADFDIDFTIKFINVDARIEAGNLVLSEWIWQNVEKRCSAT